MSSRSLGRRSLTAALAAALVAVLAGCVGVPTSGGVVPGGPLEDSGVEEFFLLPSDPVPGADQEQILVDFVRAANSSQGNYAIAKKFLTADFEQEWRPGLGVSIRSGATTVERIGETSLRYTITVEAEVDAGGRYRDVPPASQSGEYTFEQVDGEWRISSAPDGIILSPGNFLSAFDVHPLYFFDPTYQYLVPDVRWFAKRAAVSSTIVDQLLAGPSPWLQRVVVSAFPPSTERGAEPVTIDSGVATVDLSDEAGGTNGTERSRMKQQLDATLASLAPTSMITVGGLPLTVPDIGDQATQNPTVESEPLIGTEGDFGFAGGEGVSGLPELGPAITALGPLAVTLSGDQSLAAVLAGDGSVYAVRENAEPLAVDNRAGLVAPSIDPHGFIWSASAAGSAALTVFDAEGGAHDLDTSLLPAGSRIVAFDVSRDGSRVVIYLERESGPLLLVAGIVRDQENAPVSLGAEPFEFPLAEGTPVDTAWVDNRHVVTISAAGGEQVVTEFEIGGPHNPLGTLPGATVITGLNGGTSGIRVLAEGHIWRRGSSSWVDLQVEAAILATQQ